MFSALYQNHPKRCNVGDTLRALIYDEEGNEVNPADVGAEIQWSADGVEITDATDAEYTVLVGDEGVVLSVEVTIGDETYTAETEEVEPAEEPVEELTVTIVSDDEIPTVGELLTAVVTDEDGEVVDAELLHYQWYAGEDAIDESDTAILLVTDEFVGKTLSVEVTDADGNTFKSEPTAEVEAAEVEELTVSIDNTTPKVGDILTAEVVDRNGEDVSDNVTFQWYADDVAIEGADEETLVVDDELLGAALKVVVTAENGNTFESEETEAVEAYVFEIESAEATKVNKITVTFADAVDSENVSFVVTKGEAAVPTEDIEWNEEEAEAVITTSAKMTKGTYTVTATDSVTEDTDSYDFEVVAQYVDEIVITSDTALTDPDNKHIAYAYYDVFDQYGESIRSSTSISWTSSAQTTTANKTNGQIKFTNADQEWIYSNKIYVTGVNTKTGANVTKELPIGAEQNLDTIEMAGFVKKGTSEIVDTLPADFKSKEWYMVFQALDQNGNVLAADTYGKDDVTFISDNILVVKELNEFAAAPITIKGEEYKGVFVTPGIKVADGGEVTVTAIANKTGSKTNLNFVVGEDPVLVSFTFGAPAGVVADGDAVEIPFTAIDDKGNTITNFRTLAKQETFNTLTFSASDDSTLTLSEQKDGTAKLVWEDKEMLWDDPQTTDGIDRPISLTAIVVGGETDNEMISVSDKRRPDAISAIKADDVYVEGATITLTNTGSFRFLDQYGALIDTDDDASDYGDDNGFFAADAANSLKGTDFANHHFGVRVTYAGAGKLIYNDAGTDGIKDAAAATGKYTVLENGKKVTFKTATDITSAQTGEGFKFEIASIKDTDYAGKYAADWDAMSTSKYIPLTVVDITQVKNFKMNDLGTYYVGSLISAAEAGNAGDGWKTGDGVWEQSMDDLRDGTADADLANVDEASSTAYDKQIKVTGTYNGSSVTVPVSYMDYEAVGGKLTVGPNVEETKAFITGAENGVIKASELYDKTSAVGAAKLGSETIKATIKKIYSDESIGAVGDISLTVLNPDYVTALAALNNTSTADQIVTACTLADADAVPEGTLLERAQTIATTANENIDTAIAAIEAAAESGDLAAAAAATAVETLGTKKAANTAAVAYDPEHPAANANIGTVENGPVYDTASGEVKFSDQESKPAKIVGVAEAYEFTPSLTEIDEETDGYITDKLVIGDPDDDAKVYVVDQYGVYMAKGIVFRVTNIEESADEYAANSFKVEGNDSEDLIITGAERGDTFTLVLACEDEPTITASTEITVGADAWADIENATNNYKDNLVPVLDALRQAGLG